MPREQLPPDPDALEKWQNMPQNKPSRQALPPLTGGTLWLKGLLFLMIALAVIALILQTVPR